MSEVNDSFQFNHDRIQEASYNVLGGQDRRCNHVTYGKYLAKVAMETNDNDMLFVGVGQINRGGSSVVSDAQECIGLAQHNLAAGKKAMAMSEFTSAHSFFQSGIAFLPDHHWIHHYTLSLELYNLACKSAAAAGNIQTIHYLDEQVMANACSFEDTLEIQFIKVSMLAFSSKVTHAVELILKIISKLGEDIPNNPSQEYYMQEMQQTQAMVDGMSEEELLNYKMMSDPIKLHAMKFLGRLQIIAWMVSSPIHHLVILRMVSITVRYGKSLDSRFGCKKSLNSHLDI